MTKHTPVIIRLLGTTLIFRLRKGSERKPIYEFDGEAHFLRIGKLSVIFQNRAQSVAE